MYPVPISAVPNQQIEFSVDGSFWQLNIHQSINFMCADIVRDGAAVVTGIRCFGGSPLMPYPYMYEPTFGNFIFDSDADWEAFGISCNLYYLTNEEFSEYTTSLATGVMAS